MSKIRKVVIPAAGLGTRFLPATKAQPKEMLPIVDKPTIQYIVEEALAAGIEDIIIINGRNKQSIEDHFDKSFELEQTLAEKDKTELLEIAKGISNLVDIHFIRQKEPLGLGHAILKAKAFIGDEPFGVMLGDDIVASQVPALKQLMDCYDEKGGSVLGVQDVAWEHVDKYGIVDGEKLEDRVYSVNSMVEKPARDQAPTNMAILGRYVITPRIFHYLETQTPGAGGEIQLTDALLRLAEEEKVYAYNFKGTRYDVGNKMGFLQATIEFGLRRDDLKDDLKSYLEDLMANMDDRLRIE